jgi:multimeric flavodoxin WrbA
MVDGDVGKVLGIVGSPRRGGNTEILVDEVLRGAEDAGVQVEKVILNRLDIRPCLGCDTCRREGACIQKDDMQNLVSKMEQHRVWVLGTPVYWWGPTAQFKAFIDRWYGVEYGARQRELFKDRRTILVIPLEDTNPGTARHTVGMLTDVLNYLDMELFATLVAPGVLEKGKVHEYPDLLGQAWRAGRAAAE